MNHELENKIDQYLDRKLSETDRLAFEREIAENPELAQKVETFQLKRVGFDMLFKASKETMNRWHADLPVLEEEPPTLKAVWYRRDFLMAASALLVIGILIGFNVYKASNEVIIAECALVPTLKDDSAGAAPDDSASVESQSEKGIKAFKMKDYRAAVQHFRNDLMANTNPFGQEARRNTQINLAYALFQLKKYDEAGAFFRAAQQTNDALFALPPKVSKEIKWFEILCLVGNNQIEEAKIQLANNLEDPQYKALNERLNSFWRTF